MLYKTLVVGLAAGASALNIGTMATAGARAPAATMYNIDAFDGVWGMEAKMAVFEAYDPAKPRDYENFNPFERNDEASMCDFNGCFPGQSRGYKIPVRPDVSWAIQQENDKLMEKVKADPKFSAAGPGKFTRSWQDNLGAPP